MYVVSAWFGNGSLSTEKMTRARERLDAAVSPLVPESYVRRDFGAEDWGLTILHAAGPGAWRWPVLAEDGGVIAVSLGVPVGLDATAGPAGLARRLLRGEDVHAGVVPPFGLIALDHQQRLSIQQDWLGMCRLFSGTHEGIVAFSSRPSLVAQLLGAAPTPDYDGWASYAICGHFGGETSPIAGVRLLAPGERVTGRRRDGGGWELSLTTRLCVDDLIASGIAARDGGLGQALDLAAHGLTSTVAGVNDLYDGPITIGLSGGKDSRLIAASFIAGGQLPTLTTNVDTAAEGETATVLLDILRDRRGLKPEHRLYRAGDPPRVLNVGLHERIRRLQALFDYQMPSSYTVRPTGTGLLPNAFPPISISGVGGELAVGRWYPTGRGGHDEHRSTAEASAMSGLFAKIDAAAVAESVHVQERSRLARLIDHGEKVGLRGLELTDYVYLMERARRWYNSAYSIGMVTPYLAPSFVTASFAVSPEQKRDRALHTGLLMRFLPEWQEVPYVNARTPGPFTATRIWQGDGLEVMHDLLDTVQGDLTRLLRRDVVRAALIDCARGAGTSSREKILQQFAYLAVASQGFEPTGVRPPTTTFADFLHGATNASPLLPTSLAFVATRAQFLKRSRLGRAIWTAARKRAIRRRNAQR